MVSALVNLTSENRECRLKALSAQQNQVCELLHEQANMLDAMSEGDSSRLFNMPPEEGPDDYVWPMHAGKAFYAW